MRPLRLLHQSLPRIRIESLLITGDIMQIYNLVPDQAVSEPVVTEDIPRSAIFLLGYFDGVHRGHRTLLEKAVSIADNDSSSARSVVVWSMESIKKTSAESGLLTTTAEKLALFRDYGADYVVFENFEDIRSLDGETFFETCIADRFEPHAVICGKNFRFGKGASCGYAELTRYACARNIRCVVLDLLEMGDIPVSSTEIREKILSGDIETANELLGYPYSVTSVVLHGKALGRTIGCPTINQRLPMGKIEPRHGVYACTVSYEKDSTMYTHIGVCNIGSRPTVNRDENDITLETYILDFSDNLYGTTVTTRLYSRIRGERAFGSVDELSLQIQADAKAAKEMLQSTLQ